MSVILVCYSTIYGSTREVAETMAASLRQQGHEVDLQDVQKVRSLDRYQGLVLGAPLYMFRWHAPARRFLSRHRKALQGLPVAVFALGPFHNKAEELQSAREMLDKELAKFSWLKPALIEVFVGKFDPAKLRFPFSLIGPLKQIPPADERNWDAIQAWTSNLTLALKLQPL